VADLIGDTVSAPDFDAIEQGHKVPLRDAISLLWQQLQAARRLIAILQASQEGSVPVRNLVHAGTELTNSSQTLLTFGDNLEEGGAVFEGAVAINKDSSRHLVTVHLVASGGSPTESNPIFEEYVPANSTVYIPGPFRGNSGATVRAVSDAADSHVGIMVTCHERYQQAGG
jgi:hypothetical protein